MTPSGHHLTDCASLLSILERDDAALAAIASPDRTRPAYEAGAKSACAR